MVVYGTEEQIKIWKNRPNLVLFFDLFMLS